MSPASLLSSWAAVPPPCWTFQPLFAGFQPKLVDQTGFQSMDVVDCGLLTGVQPKRQAGLQPMMTLAGFQPNVALAGYSPLDVLTGLQPNVPLAGFQPSPACLTGLQSALDDVLEVPAGVQPTSWSMMHSPGFLSLQCSSSSSLVWHKLLGFLTGFQSNDEDLCLAVPWVSGPPLKVRSLT